MEFAFTINANRLFQAYSTKCKELQKQDTKQDTLLWKCLQTTINVCETHSSFTLKMHLLTASFMGIMTWESLSARPKQIMPFIEPAFGNLAKTTAAMAYYHKTCNSNTYVAHNKTEVALKIQWLHNAMDVIQKYTNHWRNVKRAASTSSLQEHAKRIEEAITTLDYDNTTYFLEAILESNFIQTMYKDTPIEIYQWQLQLRPDTNKLEYLNELMCENNRQKRTLHEITDFYSRINSVIPNTHQGMITTVVNGEKFNVLLTEKH